MKLTYTVVCGRYYPNGDIDVKYTAPCDTLEEAINRIANHLVGYPVQLIEVRYGSTVYTLDYNAGEYRPLLATA